MLGYLITIGALYLWYVYHNKIRRLRKIHHANKCVLINGCDTECGYRLALKLNEIGFKVYATVLKANSSRTSHLVKHCQHVDNMTVLEMDVTDEKHIDNCFTKVKYDLNRDGTELWALFNNADHITYGQLDRVAGDEWKRLFDVNVFGVLRVTNKFLPLIKRSKGRVVNMSSLLGRLTFQYMGPYCMAKHAVIAYSDALRIEMKTFDVIVATVELPLMRTDIKGDDKEGMVDIKGAKFLFDGNNTLDECVNDLLDAITCVNPKDYYVLNKLFGYRLEFSKTHLLNTWHSMGFKF